MTPFKIKEEVLKHEQVYERLIEELSSEKFQIGSRLPSERDFSSRLGVHISTVRRAFQDLVVGGIVEKKIGSGTYLCQNISNNWEDKPVNLIFINYSNNQQLSFIGEKIAQKRGRQCRVLYTNIENSEDLLRSCLTYRQPTIILGDLPNTALLKEHPGLFVSLSSMLYLDGIPTVRCDDALGVNMLVQYLKNMGHRKIGFLCTGNGRSALEDFQAATWVSGLEKDYHPSLKITFGNKEYSDPSHAAYEAISKIADKVNFTALLCTFDELMLGAMSALRDAGKKIPEDVAIVSIGNQPLSAYAYPKVTCIDPNLEAHLETAFDLLEHNHLHPDSIDTFRLVRPVLIERESVLPIKQKM